MLGNWIRETTTTTGTGNLTVSSVSGYPTFDNVFGTGVYFYYSILDDSSGAPFEVGIGHLSASTTLVRDLPIATYDSATYDDTAPSAVSLASGTKRVICTGVAENYAPSIQTIASVVAGANDRRGFLSSYMDGAAVATLTKDRLYYSAIDVAVWVSVASLRARTNIAGSGATVGFRIGLYNTLPNGSPGDLIAQSGNIATGTNTELTFTPGTPLRLKPGRYWTAIANDLTTQGSVYSGASSTQIGPGALGFSQAGGYGFRNVGLYETLSASWTALPSSAASSMTTLGQAPYVALILA